MLNVSKVEFDPANPEHRKFFYDYVVGKIKTVSTWKLESPYASVVDMMKAKISEYYTRKEFHVS